MKKICAIGPLLPDPAAFISRVRARFPDARIAFYTANAEAAKRAKAAGATDVIFRPLFEDLFFAPPALQRAGCDSVVLSCERAFLRIYLPFFLQILFWPRVRRFVELDGRLMPFSRTAGLFIWGVARYLLPTGGMAALLHLWWLMLLPWVLILGASRGRTQTEARTILQSTWRMLTSLTAYLVVDPGHPLLALHAAYRVLADFARGPAMLPAHPVRRALLIRLDHLGDLIATTGALDALKQGAEPWEVTMVIGPWGMPVFEADQRVDNLLVYPTEDPTFARGKRKPGASSQRRLIRKLLAKQTFDLVVLPATGPDSVALLYLPRAMQRVAVEQHDRWLGHGIAHIVAMDPEAREPDRLLQLFKAAGVDLKPMPNRLQVSASAKEEAGRLLANAGLADKPFLAIHLGASWPGRRWAVEKFAEVARRAHARFSLAPVALAGPGEEDLCRTFVEYTRDIGGAAFCEPPLPAMFALISRASAFLGNDSGFMHAAAAQGIPTLGVFGPTELHRFSPTGRVTAAASLELSCSPCVQLFCTDQRCISEMSVETVWNAFGDLMARRGAEQK